MKMSAKACLFFSIKLFQGLVKNSLHAALPTSAESLYLLYAASKNSEEMAFLIPKFSWAVG